MVEKPSLEEAPSNIAILGRYIITPEIFNILENTAPGKNGEIQLTDALKTLILLIINKIGLLLVFIIFSCLCIRKHNNFIVKTLGNIRYLMTDKIIIHFWSFYFMLVKFNYFGT